MGHFITDISAEFNPGITHPLYLIRSGLFKRLAVLAPQLSGKMMDFGCGIKPYQPLFKVEDYIGVDYQGEGETYEQSKVDVFYDGVRIPFPDSHFDSIFSSEVFEHIFNLPDILKELHRVLKPGGKILVTCPFAFGEHEVPADFARYTSYAMRHMFEQQGFEIIAAEKTGTTTDAIMQLKIVYWNNHVLSLFNRIPVVRTILRKGFYLLMNSAAIVKRQIMPRRQDLYLSNIILASKKNS
jgi:SAM-dependent methyltransferase